MVSAPKFAYEWHMTTQEWPINLDMRTVRYERIPGITMRVNADPIVCLRRFEYLARKDKKLKVRASFEGEADHDCNVVSFGLREETEHEGLFAMFVYWKRHGRILQLQLAASRWNPDPRTYDAYVAAAHRLFDPLIKVYNIKFGTRHKMRIPTREDLLPRLTPKAKKAFQRFVNRANKSSLHANDWENFYEFAYVCKITRLHLYEDEVSCLCQMAGFTKEHARDISTAFLHCASFYDWYRRTR
jgi:hypothetical protein